jgi:hypothetical protein
VVARPVDPSPAPSSRPAQGAAAHRSHEPREAKEAARILAPADRVSFGRLACSLGGEHGLAVSAVRLRQRVEQAGSIRGVGVVDLQAADRDGGDRSQRRGR